MFWRKPALSTSIKLANVCCACTASTMVLRNCFDRLLHLRKSQPSNRFPAGLSVGTRAFGSPVSSSPWLRDDIRKFSVHAKGLYKPEVTSLMRSQPSGLSASEGAVILWDELGLPINLLPDVRGGGCKIGSGGCHTTVER